MLLEFTPMPSPFPPTLAITWPQATICIEKMLSWWRLWCMALLDGSLRRHMYSWNELRFPILLNVFFSFLYPVIRDIGDISYFIA